MGVDGRQQMGQVGNTSLLEETMTADTNNYFLCIDLKSFYASVECVERGLDPMTTLLAVADPERTEKTICLAITPAMKALGIKNRCRVFEIPKNIEYIMAVPRMHLYLEYSARIYGVYLKYIAKEDIHVYSVDEAFLDVTHYLRLYNMNAKELGLRIMQDIYETTGIRATCGIGTNLYLCKIALDILAKHSPDFVGALNEARYRRVLWDHRPLTDFWSIGGGTVRRLAQYGIYTMRQVAEAPEELLYRDFGIDAELLIDHAWGRETTTIADIKAFRPASNSLSSGQVLPRDYDWQGGLLLTKEMTELQAQELLSRGLVADSLTLTLGYAKSSGLGYVRGTRTLGRTGATNSAKAIREATEALYREVALAGGPLRRIGVCMNRVRDEVCVQYSFFDDPAELERERARQRAVLYIKDRYGHNAIFQGMDLLDGARTLERNAQIGGHRA